MSGRPRARPADPVGRRQALRQLQAAIADGLTRQPRGRRDHGVPAEANGHRFRGRPQPARALIQQGRHHHILGDERGFEDRVALHCTWG